MRRSASEILRTLEMRIARLERQASNRTASMKIEFEPMHGGKKKMMTVGDFLSLAKRGAKNAFDQGKVLIYAKGSRSYLSIEWDLDEIYLADLFDFINAIESDNPKDVQALMMANNVMDDGDADGMASVAADYLARSLGRSWEIDVRRYI